MIDNKSSFYSNISFMVLAIGLLVLSGCGKAGNSDVFSGTTSSTENSIQGTLGATHGNVDGLRVIMNSKAFVPSPAGKYNEKTYLTNSDEMGRFRFVMETKPNQDVFVIFSERYSGDSIEDMAIYEVGPEEWGTYHNVSLRTAFSLRIHGDFGRGITWGAIAGTPLYSLAEGDSIRLRLPLQPLTIQLWTEKNGQVALLDSLAWSGRVEDSVLYYSGLESLACLDNIQSLRIDTMETSEYLFASVANKLALLGNNDSGRASIHTIDLCNGTYRSIASYVPSTDQYILTHADTTLLFHKEGVDIYVGDNFLARNSSFTSLTARPVWSQGSIWVVSPYYAYRYNVNNLIQQGNPQETVKINSTQCFQKETCILQYAFAVEDTLWVGISGLRYQLVDQVFVEKEFPLTIAPTVQDIHSTDNGYIWFLDQQTVYGYHMDTLVHRFSLPWSVNAFVH